MLLTVPQAFLISTSLFGWIMISFSWSALLRYHRRILNTHKLVTVYLAVLWIGSTFVVYKTFFRCQGMHSLIIYLSYMTYNFSAIAIGSYIVWKLIIRQKTNHTVEQHEPYHTDSPINTATEKEQVSLTEKQKEEISNWIASSEQNKTKITLKKMSKDLMINKAVLSAYIIQEYGDTFPNVINNMRLNRAEQLLLNKYENKQKVIDILEESGFQAPSTFFQAFHKRHKMSPTAWIKQMNKDS